MSGSAVSRRAFLAGAGGLAIGAGAGALAGRAVAASADEPSPRFIPFHGAHQAGITLPASPAASTMAAFTVTAPDRATLERALRELSDEIEALMSGRPAAERDAAFPPEDSGVLGVEPEPDDLSVVVSVGASLFDRRFGLAARRPAELVRMPFMANDRLDPARSHGDLLLTIHAGHPDTVQHALRRLMRRTRASLTMLWSVDGFNRATARREGGTGSPRNLLGFLDGTANLASDPELLDRHVWTAAGAGEPAWTAGGSYHVARIIRMLVEMWDRTSLVEQERVIGRHKAGGAPLGRARETDDPAYASDPHGARVPLDAHIRLANPRTPQTARNLILRRGFSYARGHDAAGQLDQGLAFACFQRSLVDGFIAVQRRLDGEPLEEYVRAEGGGFFFALPGVPAPGGFLGEALVS